MRKFFYIFAFAVVGALAQFIVHGLLEVWYINKLLSDFNTYSLGFSWAQWFVFHRVLSLVLLAAGIALGFWQGRYWWQRVYSARSRKHKK
jgi:hypothetical protein